MEIKYLKKKYVYQKYNILILRIICKEINIHTEFWKKINQNVQYSVNKNDFKKALPIKNFDFEIFNLFFL